MPIVFDSLKKTKEIYCIYLCKKNLFRNDSIYLLLLVNAEQNITTNANVKVEIKNFRNLEISKGNTLHSLNLFLDIFVFFKVVN